MEYNSRREFRNLFPVGPSEVFNGNGKGNIVRLNPGTYHKITVHEDGSFTVSRDAYVDDVVAFLSGAIATNDTIDYNIKHCLHKFINLMDERAVKRHGYKYNEKEREYKWIPLNTTHIAIDNLCDSIP